MRHIILLLLFIPFVSKGQKPKPYITTKSPITLLSTQDAETEALVDFVDAKEYDYKMLSQDSFTVIHLGPDHSPIVKTVYGTIPTTILGTPTMAISSDGKFGLVTNHSWRAEGSPLDKLSYKVGDPLFNSDLKTEMLSKQNLSPQLSNMISVIDLVDPNHPVVDRLLLDDKPFHILTHPDGKRFFAIGLNNFFTYELKNGELIQLAKSPIPYGIGCFWIHPNGKNIFAGRTNKWGNSVSVGQWYKINGDRVEYVTDIDIDPSLDTEYQPSGAIVRITPDGKRGFICQRTVYNGQDLADVLIVDLTLEKPMVTEVIKQVGDGLESFAFHPDGKMAVVTCLEKSSKNSLAVLDIESKPAKVLYYLDAAAFSQGVEFTPEGDKLFLGSTRNARIEVYDVLGDFELVKNPKFIKIGYGHNSLSIGKRYIPKNKK